MPPMVPILNRWTAKVQPTDPHLCWEWTGAIATSGYGVLGAQAPSRKTVYAHRLAWEMFRGPILPATPFVLHHCDNPRCVNPWHLWLGTHQDNMDDMAAKGRRSTHSGFAVFQAAKTHCPQGHPYDEANTVIHRRAGRGPSRDCLACNRIRDAKRRPRRR
jgi:hypothetical protein